jgi:hypothetical protein
MSNREGRAQRELKGGVKHGLRDAQKGLILEAQSDELAVMKAGIRIWNVGFERDLGASVIADFHDGESLSPICRS